MLHLIVLVLILRKLRTLTVTLIHDATICIS